MRQSPARPAGGDVDVAPLLRLIASDVSEISDRGSQLFILRAAHAPDIVVKLILELKLLITSLCCADPPRWGTVSSIVLAFSNALAIQPAAISSCIADLLEIYRIISGAYLNAPLNWSLRPHLLPLVQAISKGFGGPLKMNIDLLLTLTEQCTIGFVPSASFVPLMTQRSSDIVGVIVTCDPVHYVKLTEPIASDIEPVVRIYVLIWGIAVGKLLDRPPAMLALARHAQRLLSILSGVDTTLHVAAKFILDCVKATPPQLASLAKVKQEAAQVIQSSLTAPPPTMAALTRSVPLARKADVPKTPTGPVAGAAPAPPARDLTVHETPVEINQSNKLKKKIVKCNLTILPDAGILMWAAGKEAHQGDSMDLVDIQSVLAFEVTTKTGTEATLKVDGVRGGSMSFIFRDIDRANEWCTLLRAEKDAAAQQKK
jgi:hypothetical protein